MEDIVRLTRGMIPHIYMVFFVENLEPLERQRFVSRSRVVGDGGPGGRPLLIVEDGEIAALDKVRTRGKSVDRLFEFVSEFAHFGRVTILQGRMADEAQLLFQRLNESFRDKPLEVRPYGATLATILGPDALGVSVYDRG
jgi:fatty acid-binding protein DegV